MTDAQPPDEDPHRAVRRWLWFVFFSIAVMVALGGVTRLTGSGLSMVEWRPLMGTLPPMSEAEWQRVFELYQRSPQYQQVNTWMRLNDFQRIFFWEYVHRLFGRLIGLLVFVPWLYFVLLRRLSGRLAWRVFGALVLGGMQGVLGWVMVRSGLVDEPAVSHFRLAAHLLLAFLVAQYILWLILDLRPAMPGSEDGPADVRVRSALVALLVLTVVQIGFGALMAGKRAGWFALTFPDMNGHYLPGPFFPHADVLRSALNEPLAIHYLHRLLAWLLLLVVGAFTLWVLKRGGPVRLLRSVRILAGAALLQFTLGALTVILHIPTGLAVAHQLGGLALLSALVASLHAALGLGGSFVQEGKLSEGEISPRRR